MYIANCKMFSAFRSSDVAVRVELVRLGCSLIDGHKSSRRSQLSGCFIDSKSADNLFPLTHFKTISAVGWNDTAYACSAVPSSDSMRYAVPPYVMQCIRTHAVPMCVMQCFCASFSASMRHAVHPCVMQCLCMCVMWCLRASSSASVRHLCVIQVIYSEFYPLLHSSDVRCHDCYTLTWFWCTVARFGYPIAQWKNSEHSGKTDILQWHESDALHGHDSGHCARFGCSMAVA